MTNVETKVASKQVLLRKKSSGAAFLLLDVPGKFNFLTGSVIEEFESLLDEIEKDDQIKAVIIISGKPDSFVAGADLHEIIKFTEEEQALDLSTRGHHVFKRLANLSKPTVAAINGVCLGGGLELALCCDRQIATKNPSTQIGLPEVKLGFVPGLGGTQRLPRQAGVKSALEIILGAEPVSAERALEMGIIQAVVSSDDLMARAEIVALELIGQENRKLVGPALEPEKLKKLFDMTERSLRIKTKGRYPAPSEALRVVKLGLAEGLDAGLLAEAETFAKLCVSDVSRNLVFLFFTTEFARSTAAAMAVRAGSPPQTIGIIGGGLMGVTTAKLSLNCGMDVMLRSANPSRQQEANRKLAELSQTDAKAPTDKSEQVSGRTIELDSDQTFSRADLILEACEEDEAVKIKILTDIETKLEADTPIATNTSSLSVTRLANSLANSKRFIGLHFFNPVEKMPLVELVVTATTDKNVIAKATAFAHRLGKIPVTVKDSPGFLVNRILSCYLAETARLAEEKTPMNWLEDAATDFGMPMGPLAIMDEVGMDVAHMVAKSLHAAFGERLLPPESLGQSVSIGFIGRKSGRGVYLWEGDKKSGFNPQLKKELNMVYHDQKATREELDRIAEAMILPMVDEAARCLDEKVVRKPREIDLCMVMGLGFPAFRGGLLKYADSVGINEVIERLETLYAQRGPKRVVSPYLKKLAEQKRGFYSRNSEE